ncbi:tRNA (N6-isopentenyl adenosine(37)-C2)-methylthiotransferase MiaB [Petroclostridium sp. X23]|uniref:tRNA (N6-isopentenyl adenosine(37)-C2)-methylthiotransferase MiaB n=1 Tax=Petroclostridium sp. X23 TaxID=3045146 RepID=UPI0024AD64BF|nr:tRNA (N6-isopentenyl adenosine(37)-C2)-methylthiotransferase MiaB [Petroclostridium sp. X23]WHH59558.1 tRNA (N6-isopentenyl adenosine(37)-C2)-methylthiotransferase MiaB [Petroclostridium sp. X23]
MSKREKINIPIEEINKQKEAIARVREKNDFDMQRSGKQKLAIIITYGCQQNENDSERLRGMLRDMGYSFTEDREEADLILYNTCCVRENAELKVFGNIGALKHLKARKPHLLIGICGCMMQQEHIVEQIKKKYKHVDMVFGTHTLYKFPETLEKAMNEAYTVIDVMNTDGYIVEDIPIHREGTVKAWVSIMYGCNNFCSYCIVPYVRGRERSRNPKDVISEVSQLVAEGYKEITLLGQNVNSYGNDLEADIDFADLLQMVNDIEGVKRIRFMTSHPKDISDKLIDVMNKCKHVCEQLHLPFQAGSNNVLELMNRKYTREKYLEIIRKVKQAIPDVALTSDIIVGFPGETNEDFEGTLDIIKQVEFDSLFTFIYSPRKGTPAEKMDDVLSKKEKQANFQKLLDIQNEISLKKNQQYLGKNVEVLVEGYSKNNPDMLTGRTRTGKIINFSGNEELIGTFINVLVEDVQTWSLTGRHVKEDI